jgi:elongation factor Ts
MAEVSAAAVKTLRERTGLPMMDCKKALQEVGGDPEAAVEWLRKHGKKTMEKRATRETSFGRVAVYADLNAGVGAMVEMQCESAPVANGQDFAVLVGDMVRQLATGPGAASPDDLLGQPSPSQPGVTLRQQMDDLVNRIREVFRLRRVVRIDAPCGGYAHHNGALGVLLQIEGGNAELAKDVCMHVAFSRPAAVAREDLDPAAVAKEREILTEAARQEGKPEKVLPKMVEGRMKDFFAKQCLLEQPFVKDASQTVGQLIEAGGMKILGFVLWDLGKE